MVNLVEYNTISAIVHATVNLETTITVYSDTLTESIAIILS